MAYLAHMFALFQGTIVIPADFAAYVLEGAGIIIVGLQGWLARSTLATRDAIKDLHYIVKGDEKTNGLRDDMRLVKGEVEEIRRHLTRNRRHFPARDTPDDLFDEDIQ